MGVVDMSMPERWGVLQFADERVNETEKSPLPFWRARAVAMAVHNAQQAYSGGAQQSTGSATRESGYAATIKELLPHAPPRSLDAGCTGAITLKLYGYFEPYTDRSDDILAEALQWITCLIMLTLLLTMTNADNVQYYMIALQLTAVFVIFVVFAVFVAVIHIVVAVFAFLVRVLAVLVCLAVLVSFAILAILVSRSFTISLAS